ncbi:MAG: 50S ribosomal protein L6 [Nanoarchaeota archaeon]
MKTQETIIETLDIPDKVRITQKESMFEITGTKGTVAMQLHTPQLEIRPEGNKLLFIVKKKYTQREKKLIFTYKAHIKNACKGVIEGHVYRLKICSGHFPMTVGLKGNTFEVKNFIGETIPRTMRLREGVKVVVNGDEVVVEGIDLARVSQTAADIEQLTKRPGYDKRIFMDGIWITEKDGEQLG